MLPEVPGCSIVGFVKSGNNLLRRDHKVPNLALDEDSYSREKNSQATLVGSDYNDSNTESDLADGRSAMSDTFPLYKTILMSRKKRLNLIQVQPSAIGPRPSILPVPSSRNRSFLRGAFRRANAARYKYQRLNADQVRLLVIKPGEPADEVNATLRTIKADDLGSAGYPYEALSYHWGEGEQDKPIVIRNDSGDAPIKSMSEAVFPLLSAEGVRTQRLYVKPNLHAALTHLRSKTDLVPLWVDAVCINQRDEQEKKDQVMKMTGIYRKAGRVCIWLGPENLVSHQAMSFIKDVIHPDKLGDLLSDAKYIPRWATLFALLKWSWFSRSWVIQELALAK
jgi:hypothetical protein